VVLAALGIAVLGIAVYALQHPSGSKATAGTATRTVTTAPTSPKPAPTHASTSSAPTTSAANGKLPLVVLNNSTVQGLAQRARDSFTAGGWTVTSIGNEQNDIISTCAYYDPSTPGAQQAAQQLMQQFPAIKRTAPKFPELPAGPVVVVLTSDYASG
jgi:hypothetical protein